MPYGNNFGTAYGRGNFPEISGDSHVVDFTEAANGTFLGEWQFYAQNDDSGLSLIGEDDPDDYYRVVDGRALFNYDRQPDSGDPSVLRGFWASPNFGIGNTDVNAAIVFDNFLSIIGYLDFDFEIIVACRGDAQISSPGYYAKVTASRTSGTWVTTRTSFGFIGQDLALSELAAHNFEYAANDDFWQTNSQHALELNLVQGAAQVSLSGLAVINYEDISITPAGRLFVAVKMLQSNGVTQTPLPIVKGIYYDDVTKTRYRLKPHAKPTDGGALNLPHTETVCVNIKELLAAGIVTKVGFRAFRVAENLGDPILVDGPHEQYSLASGMLLTALKDYVGQEFLVLRMGLEDLRVRRGWN